MDIGIGIGVGLLAGILAGLMGVGGGVVLVPGMVLLMGVDQHTAQGVSLAVIALIAFFGAFSHYRLENVKLRVALWIIPAAAIFSFVGSLVANELGEALLRQLVGILIIIVGILMVVKAWRARELTS